MIQTFTIYTINMHPPYILQTTLASCLIVVAPMTANCKPRNVCIELNLTGKFLLTQVTSFLRAIISVLSPQFNDM